MTGLEFKKVRKHLRFTQGCLGEFMGISARGVQKIEYSDTVRLVNEHSILWIAFNEFGFRFDDDFELIRNEPPTALPEHVGGGVFVRSV